MDSELEVVEGVERGGVGVLGGLDMLGIVDVLDVLVEGLARLEVRLAVAVSEREA